MSIALAKPLTQDEFFGWAETQDGRYEFDGNQPIAMGGGTAGHAVISKNILIALGTRLKNSACQPLGSDAGVETIYPNVRYPDALITCTRFEPDIKTIPGVLVIFEVISPSTAKDDRLDKVLEYAAVPSIRRYIIAETSFPGLTILERQSAEEPWQSSPLKSGETLRLPEIGIEIPIDEFYTGIDFAQKMIVGS